MYVRAELSVRENLGGRGKERRNMGGRTLALWRDHSMPCLALPKSCYMLRRLHQPANLYAALRFPSPQSLQLPIITTKLSLLYL